MMAGIALCFLASGCTSNSDDGPLTEWQGNGGGARSTRTQPFSQRTTLAAYSAPNNDQSLYYPGSGQMVGRGTTSALDPALASGAPVTLNLANASIEAAARAVMGDILKLNYSVAPNLPGTVTIQTSRPVSRGELIRLFQDALQANGAAIIKTGQVYRIDNAQQARNAVSGIEVGGAGTGSDRIGAGVRIVPLRYVSASEMQRILEPMVGRTVVVGADDTRNTLTLSGTSQEISSVLDTISVFDVDVMKGMSFAVIPVRSAQPDAIADELRNVFGTGGTKGMIRFLPNNRLRSILIASPQREYLTRAEMWVRRLDSRAQGQEKQLYTYKVQNRSAKELVTIVNDMFSNGKQSADQPQRNVAPRYQDTSVQSASAAGNGGGGTQQGVPVSDPTGQIPEDSVTFEPGAGSGSARDAQVSGGSERVRVAADEGNNSLLVLAASSDYQRVLSIIQNLDVSPRQVLIEATIAEVSLTDDLKFGVRWYLQHKNAGYMFTDQASKAFDSTFPGFSYALGLANTQVTLDALNKVSHVNIVSAPSLMVLDNKTATLQVGDQVPIVTQSATSVQDPGAPIVNSVNYRDTGVIMQITPRINDSGRVLLDISQEVSSVSGTTSSGIDSPTIKQRKVKTTVMVSDGQVLTLGGIIQNQNSRDSTKVPILGDIPLIGNAFKSKGNSIGRTELIVLLTPRVVYDARDAQDATQEYRNRLGFGTGRPMGRVRRDAPIGQTAQRLFE
jgi:general secretion pathway protein D